MIRVKRFHHLATGTNLFLYPGPNKKAWISAYFSKSTNRVGVYFKTANDQEGQEILRLLADQKEQIKLELGSGELWGGEENVHVGVRLQCNNVFSDESTGRRLQNSSINGSTHS
jgi:hypothetical protein